MSKFLSVIESHIPEDLTVAAAKHLCDALDSAGIKYRRNVGDANILVKLGGDVFRLKITPKADAVEDAEDVANTPEDKEAAIQARALKAASAVTSSDPRAVQSKKRLSDTVNTAYTQLSNKVNTAVSKL